MTTPIETIRQEIARLRGLEKHASFGPWITIANGGRFQNLNPKFNIDANAATGDGDPVTVCEDIKEKNAKFIAESRSALPKTLSALEMLLAAVESGEYNWEVNKNCDCCANNDSIYKELTDAIESAAKILGAG